MQVFAELKFRWSDVDFVFLIYYVNMDVGSEGVGICRSDDILIVKPEYDQIW